MTKLIILFIAIFLIFKKASSVGICQICKNDDCYSPDGIHYFTNTTTCSKANVDEAYSAINEAYRQNYNAPSDVGECGCIDIKSTIVLTEGNTEEFTYKGCIETGFDVNKVKPNPAHTKAEKRETFEACYTKQCNMKPIIITPAPETTSTKQPAQTLTCYACNGEDDCNQENLKTVDCAVNSNTLTTYVALSNHYQIQLRSPQKTEYECFTIDSKLTGNIESHLVYKGCVEKGFEGCKQKYNPDIYRKETKKHCKICPEELCNKNGSNVVVTSFWWAVLSLLVAKRF